MNLTAHPRHRSEERQLNPDVLIVEDDEGIREGLKLFFEARSVPAHWAANGAEALRFVGESEGAPRLCIVDRHLPDTDGLILLRKLRKRLPSTTVLYLFTADETDERVVRQAGADGYISKPFDGDLLVDLALRHLDGGCPGARDRVISANI